MPGRFIVDTGMVVCAAHGACFTIPAGECIAGPCRGDRLRELPAEVRADPQVIAAYIGRSHASGTSGQPEP